MTEQHNDYTEMDGGDYDECFLSMFVFYGIVFKVYGFPANAAIESFVSCNMARKQYPFS